MLPSLQPSLISIVEPSFEPTETAAPLTDSNIHSSVDDWYNGINSDYGPIENWDVSRVTYMSGIFGGKDDFNADISDWNMARVTDTSVSCLI